MTLAPVREALPEEARVLGARHGDLRDYAYAAHGLEIEEYQLSWEHALDTLDRVVIVCPPDTYKSTTVQLWVEKALGRNRNHRILWLMNAGAQSEKRVMTVMQTIESNTVYKKAFKLEPDYKSGWTKSTLYVQRDIESPDPSLMGVGLDGPYQGSHFDTIVIDDPTNQKDVKSPTTMEMQRTLVRGVIIDRLSDKGRIVVILTRWGENDLVSTFEDMGFTIIQMPVLGDYPWGPTISNTRFPLSRIPIIRRDKTDALFNLTYMCNPLAMQGGIIKRDHIRYWNKDNLPKNATLTLMAVDPASSVKAKSDPSAIGMGLLDPRTRALYITDMVDLRLEVPDLEAEIIKRAKQTAGLVGIGVETVGFQMSLVQRLRREKNLPIRELPYRSRRQATMKAIGLDRDKMNRALYVDSKFASGQLFLPEYPLPLFEGVSYEDELVTFDDSGRGHDDRVDCTAFLCALADAYSAPAFKIRIR